MATKPKMKSTLEAVAAAVDALRRETATKDDIRTLRKEMKADIRAIREEMATKQELNGLRDELKGDILLLRKVTATDKSELTEKIGELAENISLLPTREDVLNAVYTAKSELSEQIDGLRYAKEIDELRARVNVLERKVGVKRAA